jgi:hypothetical protein
MLPWRNRRSDRLCMHQSEFILQSLLLKLNSQLLAHKNAFTGQERHTYIVHHSRPIVNTIYSMILNCEASHQCSDMSTMPSYCPPKRTSLGRGTEKHSPLYVKLLSARKTLQPLIYSRTMNAKTKLLCECLRYPKKPDFEIALERKRMIERRAGTFSKEVTGPTFARRIRCEDLPGRQ